MTRYNDILNGIQDSLEAAQKTYKGTKRSDLKDSDFLFPENRSFPIVSPQDIPDAISNFGRMKGNMSYDAFLKKLYNMAKRKGPEFVAALPKATKDKLGIKSTTAEENMDFTQVDDMETETPEMELMEYKKDFYDMSVGSIRAIMTHAQVILDNLENPSIAENLTESWLQGRIAITEDYMRTIHDFVMFVSEGSDTTSDAGSKPGLWDNIRKKKERMGKNYKPAKPGDKDRPDPSSWKKAQK